MTSHRERKSVVACCVKSGARAFSDVVLITPSVFTAKTGRSTSCTTAGDVFAVLLRSVVLVCPGSPFNGVFMILPTLRYFVLLKQILRHGSTIDSKHVRSGVSSAEGYCKQMP